MTHAHPVQKLVLEWNGEGHNSIHRQDVKIDSIAVRMEN